jgi:hypothetical protein
MQPNELKALAATDVRTATADQIRALFEWYDFTDPKGHPLINCVPFVELVERATWDEEAPVLIEEHHADGAHWIVSFDGCNPEPEMAVECASREAAEGLILIAGRLAGKVKHATA